MIHKEIPTINDVQKVNSQKLIEELESQQVHESA